MSEKMTPSLHTIDTPKTKKEKLHEETRMREEKERLYVTERLGLLADTTWEEINQKFDPALVLVCKVETHAGYYFQIPKIWKAYQKALEFVWNEMERLNSKELTVEVDKLLSLYDDETGVLDVLFAIEHEQEAKESELRTVAKKDCAVIHQKLKHLEMCTDITKEDYQKLYKRWKQLGRAIGMLGGGGVDHTR